MLLNKLDFNRLVRANILKLTPYSSARGEFKGSASVFLDANERRTERKYIVETDEGARKDTSVEALAKLKPVCSTRWVLLQRETHHKLPTALPSL